MSRPNKHAILDHWYERTDAVERIEADNPLSERSRSTRGDASRSIAVALIAQTILENTMRTSLLLALVVLGVSGCTATVETPAPPPTVTYQQAPPPPSQTTVVTRPSY